MASGTDRAGRSLLHYAALQGRVAEVTACLHGHCVEVNRADKAGFTPLHFAAQGQQAHVARLLIEAGADLHARNKFGATALLVALFNVRDGSGDVVRVLLDAGATPDAQNNHGVSARTLAAMVVNYDLGKFFTP